MCWSFAQSMLLLRWVPSFWWTVLPKAFMSFPSAVVRGCRCGSFSQGSSSIHMQCVTDAEGVNCSSPSSSFCLLLILSLSVCSSWRADGLTISQAGSLPPGPMSARRALAISVEPSRLRCKFLGALPVAGALSLVLVLDALVSAAVETSCPLDAATVAYLLLGSALVAAL